jgi:uridine kinase
MARAYAIGIAGRTGSGKTLFAKKVCNCFTPLEVVLLHQDNYYRDLSDIPLEEREVKNFDRPEAFDLPLLTEHLTLLKKGQPVRQPVYDFSEHRRSGEYVRIEPGRVVVLEGLLVFHPPELRDLFDLRVYMEGDDTQCLIRRIRRDVEERGRSHDSVLKQYQETVQPMYLKYVLPTRSYAHLIVPQGGLNGPAVEAVRGLISHILRGGDAIREEA